MVRSTRLISDPMICEKYEYSDEERSYISQNIIEIHKISKSFYLYLKSIENNQYPDPFTEPTQILHQR